MGRIGRSMQLVGQSYRILMQDKELMVLPLISGIVIAAVAASFFFSMDIGANEFDRGNPAHLAAGFSFYVITYAVGIFFQAAVVAGATERMRGGNPTVSSSLGAAWKRIGAILLWAVVAATVGMILRTVQERLGFVGKIIAGFAGVAWSLATFFMVPVLVLEEHSVHESFTRSVATFRKTWGESMVGNLSIGAAAIVGWVTLVAIAGLIAWAGAGWLALATFFAGAVLLVMLTSALQGVYLASLYRYSVDGSVPTGFDRDTFQYAFLPKP
jgi:hypothetical protein